MERLWPECQLTTLAYGLWLAIEDALEIFYYYYYY